MTPCQVSGCFLLTEKEERINIDNIEQNPKEPELPLLIMIIRAFSAMTHK